MDALPDWCEPLVDAERMRAIDRFAIEQRGVPGSELMERAGTGVARAVEELAPAGPVAVVCGKGNNGGDGFVAARLLREAGREVHVLCTAAPSDYSGDALLNLERLPGAPPFARAFEEGGGEARDAAALLDGAAAIVDALLGTGFGGAPRGSVGRAIEAIRAAGRPVVSVDVPSGVDASTGAVAGTAVRADRTVTFHLGKPGLWIDPGKDHRGEVRVIDIGIPRDALALTGAARAGRDRQGGDEGPIGLIAPRILSGLPRRGRRSTKFRSGHVLVVGGSRGLTGAPRMTGHAALRAGAGYVTVCLPACVQATVAAAEPPELVTRALADDPREGSFAPGALDGVLEAAGRGGAAALGPGLGRSEGALALARGVAAQAELPLVLDADGLNAHAGHLDGLAARVAPTVLTPHAGELARLLERTSAEIERERLASVREAAARAGSIVVLKGDDSLVASPGGMVAVSPGATPALASAGTGDVLTGVIAALLAGGLDAFTAAAAGVLLHAAAGREAERRQGVAEGVIATDVIAALPAARARRGGGGPQ
jgi:hydroxyethylthiazole kinase-like uncharacterized protein yjeF